jgi:rhamnosyltransferase
LDAKSIRSSHGAAPITAIVIHAYYPEELALILNRLKTIPCEFDLILTGSTENLFANLDQRIPEKARSVNLFIYQNRGRDVGPFVDLIRRGVFDKYQSVLKLHTKRSSYSDKGTLWLETLIDGLIPSPSQVTKIVEAFTELKVGVCGLESQFLVNGHKFWGDNKRTVVKIRANLGLRNLPYDLGFFAGTMFWFSPQSLQALKKLDSSRCLFRYPKERGQRDGTLAHALERIFCDVSISSGHSISSTEEPTLDLQFNKCFENSIPVQKL